MLVAIGCAGIMNLLSKESNEAVAYKIIQLICTIGSNGKGRDHITSTILMRYTCSPPWMRASSALNNTPYKTYLDFPPLVA